MKRTLKSYHQRLFTPAFISLWVLITIIGVFHHTRSENIRLNTIKTNIDIITSRIVNLYETRSDDQAPGYISFIDNYFSTTEYYNLCISVFDVELGAPLCSMGFPLPPPKGITPNESYKYNVNEVSIKDAFYYREKYTSDRRVAVVALMPEGGSSLNSLAGEIWFFTFLFTLGGIMSLFAYWFTGYLARNIQNLRNFVDCAVKDENFDESFEFSDDELGEISHQIINLYNARSAAIEQTEKEHAAAIKAVEDRAKHRKQVTSNLSHELKTPLGIIKGYVETILASPGIDRQIARNFLEKTQHQIFRLQDLLNDISTITRLEDGEGSILLEKVDFYSLASDLTAEISETGLNEGKKLILDIPADCYVKGNANLLSAMLLNLTKNAVIHSGGDTIGLTLLEKNDTHYRFAFYDNGNGVSEEHLPFLFDRFYRVDTGRSRKVGGTGLGLSIVRHTVTSLGGEISAKNREEGGLEIDFSLPIWTDDNKQD